MQTYPFELPKLQYDYDALEPFVSAETMKTHHLKHHKSYVDKLNELVKGDDFLNELPLDQLISKENLNKIDEDTAEKIRNFGGGHYNHTLYFELLSVKPQKPGKMLSKLINDQFGDFKTFEKEFKNKAESHFGSGWCWLVLSKHGLTVKTTKNQDNPINFELCTPIMGIDLWEHAYYLDHKNRKKDYISKIWQKINWKEFDNKVLEAENVK